MQMRRAQLPENSYRQRLAASGIAKTLCRVFLNLSYAENRGKAVIPSEVRNLTIEVAVTPSTLCDAAANGGSFALLRMTARHVLSLFCAENLTARNPTLNAGIIHSAHVRP